MEDIESSSSNGSSKLSHVYIDIQQDEQNISIDNIGNEDNLEHDISNQQNTFLSGYDSPVTMSIYGSNNNSNHGSDNSDHEQIADSSSNHFLPANTLSLDCLLYTSPSPRD